MKTKQFKTAKSLALISKFHICLTKKELTSFEKDVLKIQKILSVHEGYELGLESAAFDSITSFMSAIGGDKKNKFKTYNGIMFGFGLFLAKAIISKHGGVLIKDQINGDIDVLVAHGNDGAYRIFSPHYIIKQSFRGEVTDFNEYMEVIDGIMNINPADLISEITTN